VQAKRHRALHPHSRGELAVAVAARVDAAGSSPLAWGTQNGQVTSNAGSRFIPTRVGNSGASSSAAATTTVHPHSRGELLLGDPGEDGVGGSSPLAWGTLGGLLVEFEVPRFIPTRVGNSNP